MLTKTNSQFLTANVFVTDFLVDTQTFNTLKEKITDQYLKNIDIPGFRKGFAPREKAMAKADMLYLENLIWNETVTRNYMEADKTVRTELDIEPKRVVLAIALSQDSTTIGTTDEGFKFQLVSNLLPNVKLDFLSDMTVVSPTEADLPKRISKEDFVAKEYAGFLNAFNEFEEVDAPVGVNSRVVADIIEENVTEGTPAKESKGALINLGVGQFPVEFEANLVGAKTGETKSFSLNISNPNTDQAQSLKFTITIQSVQTPKYNNIDELFTEVEMVKTNFESVQKISQNLEDRYNAETQTMLVDTKMKFAITKAVQLAGEIDIDSEIAQSEIERIYADISSNPNPVEIFNNTQFPHTAIATAETLKQEITNYVNGEFKLSKILMVIYYQKVTNQNTEQEINEAYKEIIKSPEKYGYAKDLDAETLKNNIFDTLLRNKSLEFLMSVTKFSD